MATQKKAMHFVIIMITPSPTLNNLRVFYRMKIIITLKENDKPCLVIGWVWKGIVPRCARQKPAYLSLAIIKILLLNIFFMYNARLNGMRINGWRN